MRRGRRMIHRGERKSLSLTLVTVTTGDYFDNKSHDLCIFEDDEGVTYYYNAPYPGSFLEIMTYAKRRERFNISAELVAYENDDRSYDMFNPKILKMKQS